MLKSDLFDMEDEDLKKRMSHGHINDDYKACFNILLLRRHERLVDKTGELVNETKALVRKTWGLAIATWAVAGAAIVTILIQLFSKGAAGRP